MLFSFCLWQTFGLLEEYQCDFSFVVVIVSAFFISSSSRAAIWRCGGKSTTEDDEVSSTTFPAFSRDDGVVVGLVGKTRRRRCWSFFFFFAFPTLFSSFIHAPEERRRNWQINSFPVSLWLRFCILFSSLCCYETVFSAYRERMGVKKNEEKGNIVWNAWKLFSTSWPTWKNPEWGKKKSWVATCLNEEQKRSL